MKKRIFSLRMWLMLLATLLVFGAVFGMQWFGSKMMNQAMDNMPRPTATITTTEVTTTNWQPAVAAVGTIAAINGARLAAEVPGTVTAIMFDNGAEVAADDVILTLNSAPERAELAALEAANELAGQELKRARSLVTERNISKSELDQRGSELDQARARVAEQQARIEQKTLRAPYAGRLGIRRYNVGDYVVAGDTIIELQSLDQLYLNFSLPEQYHRQVSEGMVVTATVAALEGEEFQGPITAIAPLIDPDTRNFALQVTLKNRDQLLRPGMFATLSLALGDTIDQLVIPQTAVAYRPYGNSVYVLQRADDTLTVSQRFVTLGPVRGDLIAIEKGLEPGETVATSGLLKLDTGTPVVIDNSVQPAASLTPRPDNS